MTPCRSYSKRGTDVLYSYSTTFDQSYGRLLMNSEGPVKRIFLKPQISKLLNTSSMSFKLSHLLFT